MPTGYRLERASTGRAGCVGKKPCKGTKIEKGELRFGTWVVIQEHGGWKWRHWGCVTPEVLANIKKEWPDVTEIDGYDEIPESYQEKVAKAWEDGHVAEEDIPESAKYLPGEEPQRSPKKSKKTAGEETEDGEKPRAESTGGKKRKAEAKKEADEDVADEKDVADEDVKPAKKVKASKKLKAEPHGDPAEASTSKESNPGGDGEVKPEKSKAKSKAKKEEVSDDDAPAPAATKSRKSARGKA